MGRIEPHAGRIATAAAVTAAAVGAGTLFALPAGAKEGVRAKLQRPVKLGTPAGRTIDVRWRLQDAEGHPFGASGIYLRIARCGRRPLRVDATERSNGYSARVKVPRGGIRKLTVGLEGWRMYPSGRTERADIFFEFSPPLRRRCR